MDELIREFMSQKRFAVVGATDNKDKFGYKIFRNLFDRGYEVYPVNPRLGQIDGVKCFPSLSAIPVQVDVVNMVVPPPITAEVLREAKELGLERIWLQPGSGSDDVIRYCQDNGLKVVHGVCVMHN